MFLEASLISEHFFSKFESIGCQATAKNLTIYAINSDKIVPVIKISVI